LSPADAIQAFLADLGALPVDADPTHVAEDIASLRRVFVGDAEFVAALAAVAHELQVAVRRPQTHGKQVHHALTGWRRCAFQSKRVPKAAADLRLVFRPKNGRIELRAFGHRRIPDSVYFLAERR